MAIERRDRVKDSTTTTGTGTVTLSGTAPDGFRAITDAHTNGATVRYAISLGTEWEVGEGVFTTSGNTLTRATVLASSNAGALVNFSAGTKTVITTLTAAEIDVRVSKAETATLTAGYAATPVDDGTKSSGTYTPAETTGSMRYIVNGGAFTLAPPTNNTTLIVQITNNASAGAITTSGFTKVTGTAPGTTDGDDFLAYITKINGFSHLHWQALQ